MLYKKSTERIDVEKIEYTLLPAKTWRMEDGTIKVGRTVFNHCQIVGTVAAALLDRLPQKVRGCLFPEGAHFAAACHDIGKVSPTFAAKLFQAAGINIPLVYPQLAGISNPSMESAWGGHAGVSEVTAKAMGAGRYIPEILGQHHGFSPQVDTYRADSDVFGGMIWQQEREHLVAALKNALMADWPVVENHAQARAIAGLTAVADWIGSGQFFENPHADWLPQVEQALDDAGFVAAKIRPNLSFEAIFEFTPREAQCQLIRLADQPGVYVLEAPMGLGKTEAALYVAYQQLAKGQASGIYFALPTQLTSNKIFDRFNGFLQKILHEDCRHRRSLLLHGNAWLVETEMGEEGCPGGSWFNSSKRGLLAPFAVGTIDQALMAAMNVKHGFVRAFGLAGKVVILDEVHTYDAYTGTILNELVDLLRQLQCTVIILSATLSHERRGKLLGIDVQGTAYPLVTAMPLQGELTEQSVATGARQQVAIVTQAQNELALEEVLLRAEQGQQVLWIENTVGDAQQRFLDLAARSADRGIACGLLHSRFTPSHRQSNEDRWVSAFGKAGWEERAAQGRILVGTQVLEQSLDIDADFLVTRFAPTDLLLQRLGRLWRHGNTPRPVQACCEAWLLAPALDAAIAHPKQAFSASAAVYSPYVLCRSLEVWQAKALLSLPDDIRCMVEATYADREEQGDMARWRHELECGDKQRWKGLQALQQLARVTLSRHGKTLPESKAQTRYSESDSIEILLLRSCTPRPAEQVTEMVLINGERVILPWRINLRSKPQWRQLSAILMKQVVHCRKEQAPIAIAAKHLEKIGLHHCFYLGKPEDDVALLRVALMDNSGEMHGLYGEPLHEKFSYNYRDDLGLRIVKRKE